MNFFSKKYDAVDQPYFSLEDILGKAEKLENLFYVFHINVGSLNTNFGKLEELSFTKKEVNVVAVSKL